MIVSEEEAKAKWCPFAKSRAVSVTSPKGQMSTAYWPEPHDDSYADIRCIASQCMMWRWKRIEEYRRAQMGDTHHGDEPHIPMEQHPLSERPHLQANHKGRFALIPRGYCGMAGGDQ